MKYHPRNQIDIETNRALLHNDTYIEVIQYIILLLDLPQFLLKSETPIRASTRKYFPVSLKIRYKSNKINYIFQNIDTYYYLSLQYNVKHKYCRSYWRK